MFSVTLDRYALMNDAIKLSSWEVIQEQLPDDRALEQRVGRLVFTSACHQAMAAPNR